MVIAATTKLWTSDELFALRPSKKVDRWLYRGELRESKMTKRNPSHTRTVSHTSALLVNWLKLQPKPRGEVHTGEAYFRIRREPETNVGIDVAIASHEQQAVTTKKASYIDGAPILAVEVLSPYDKVKDIREAIDEYLECGVSEVWIIDPYDETLKVYNPDKSLVFFGLADTYAGSVVLPGLKFNIPELFG